MLATRFASARNEASVFAYSVTLTRSMKPGGASLSSSQASYRPILVTALTNGGSAQTVSPAWNVGRGEQEGPSDVRLSLDDAPSQPSRFARFASAFFVASPVLYSNPYLLVFLLFRHHEHLYRYLSLLHSLRHLLSSLSPTAASRFTATFHLRHKRPTIIPPLPLRHRFFVIEFQPLSLCSRRSQRGSSAQSRQVCQRRCLSLFRNKLTLSL